MKHFSRIAAIATALLLLSSCIDERYDLADKEIDMDMTVGGEELALPFGSTEKITFEEILPVENTDYLVTDENGDYCIVSDNTVFSEDITVSEITFGNSRASELGMNFGSVPASGGLPSEEFPFRLPEELTINLTFDEIQLEDIVKRIDIVEFDACAQIAIELTSEAVDELTIDEMSLVFPEWLVLENGGNTAVISGVVSKDRPLLSEILATGIDLRGNTDMYDDATHILALDGEITVDASVTVFGGDITGTEGDLTLEATIEVRSPDGGNEISVTAIEGVADLASEPVTESIELGFDDEMISDDYILDLEGASIFLSLDNGTPVSASFSGVIETFDGNGGKIAEIAFETPVIDASSTSSFRISETGEASGQYAGVAVDNFDDLLYRIPKSIQITFTAESDSECRIEPGTTYEVSGECHIEAPARFGSDLDISTDYTISGISGTFSDIGISVEQLIINATAVSTIPAKITLSAGATDASGNPIDGIDIKIGNGDSLEINPAENGEASSEISISITQTAEGAIYALDSITIHAKVSEGNGENINTEDYLLLQNISLTIPGGVGIDGEKLL